MELASNSGYDDVHDYAMDTYRLRIRRALRAFRLTPNPGLIEELARLMDMSAAERVLDHTADRSLPNPEHPAAVDLRSRLRHAEVVTSSVIDAPKRVLDQWSPRLDDVQRQLLSEFVADVRVADALPSREALAVSAGDASAATAHQVVALIETRIELAETDPCTAQAAPMLASLLDDVLLIAGQGFRDAAWINQLPPDVDFIDHCEPSLAPSSFTTRPE